MSKKQYLSPAVELQFLFLDDVLTTSVGGVVTDDGGVIISPWEIWSDINDKGGQS